MAKQMTAITLEPSDVERIGEIRKYTSQWFDSASVSSSVRAAVRLYSDLIRVGKIDEVRAMAKSLVEEPKVAPSDFGDIARRDSETY